MESVDQCWYSAFCYNSFTLVTRVQDCSIKRVLSCKWMVMYHHPDAVVERIKGAIVLCRYDSGGNLAFQGVVKMIGVHRDIDCNISIEI
jgi:hypothetical protein